LIAARIFSHEQNYIDIFTLVVLKSLATQGIEFEHKRPSKWLFPFDSSSSGPCRRAAAASASTPLYNYYSELEAGNHVDITKNKKY
jgi:hypothetical protein